MSVPPGSAVSAASSSAGSAAAASATSSSSSSGSLWLSNALDLQDPSALHAATQLRFFIQRVQEEGFNACLSHYTNHVELLAIANTSAIAEQSLRTGCYLVQAMILVHVWLLQKKLNLLQEMEKPAEAAEAAPAAAAAAIVPASSPPLQQPPSLGSANPRNPDVESDDLLGQHRLAIQCSVALFYHGPRSQSQRPSPTVLWKATFAVQLYSVRNHPLFQQSLQPVLQCICISKLELLHALFHSQRLIPLIDAIRLCRHYHISNHAVTTAMATEEMKDLLKKFHDVSFIRESEDEWNSIEYQIHQSFAVACVKATVATKQKPLQEYVQTNLNSYRRGATASASSTTAAGDGGPADVNRSSRDAFFLNPSNLLQPECTMNLEDAKEALDDQFMDAPHSRSKHKRRAEGASRLISSRRRDRSRIRERSEGKEEEEENADPEEDGEDINHPHAKRSRHHSHVDQTELVTLREAVADLKELLTDCRVQLQQAQSATQVAHSAAFRRAILEQVTHVDNNTKAGADEVTAEDGIAQINQSTETAAAAAAASTSGSAGAAASASPSSLHPLRPIMHASVVSVSTPLTLSNRWVLDCLPLRSLSEPGAYSSVGLGTIVQINSCPTSMHTISSLRVHHSVRQLLKKNKVSSVVCSLPVQQCLYKQCYAISRKSQGYWDISPLAVEMAVFQHLQQDSSCPYLPKVFGMGNMVNSMKTQFAVAADVAADASVPPLQQILSLPDVSYHAIHSVMLMEWVRGLTLWTLLHTLPEGVQALKSNEMTDSQSTDSTALYNSTGLYDGPRRSIPDDNLIDHDLYTCRLRWCVQLARGVKDLHRRGIIHRDIKPNNILFTSPRIFTWMQTYNKLEGMRALTDTMGDQIHPLSTILSSTSAAESQRSLEVDGFGWGHHQPQTVDEDVMGARLVIVDFNGCLLLSDSYASKLECNRDPYDWIGGTAEYRETWWMESVHQSTAQAAGKVSVKQIMPQALRDDAWHDVDQFAVGLVMLDLLRGVAASASNSVAHRKYFTLYCKQMKEKDCLHVPSVSEYLLMAELRDEDWTPQFNKANDELRQWMLECASPEFRQLLHSMTRIRWSREYEASMITRAANLNSLQPVPTMAQIETILMTEMSYKRSSNSAAE